MIIRLIQHCILNKLRLTKLYFHKMIYISRAPPSPNKKEHTKVKQHIITQRYKSSMKIEVYGRPWLLFLQMSRYSVQDVYEVQLVQSMILSVRINQSIPWVRRFHRYCLPGHEAETRDHMTL